MITKRVIFLFCPESPLGSRIGFSSFGNDFTVPTSMS